MTLAVPASLPFVLAAAVTQAAPPSCDLLFTGGRVVDGTGAPWFRGDVCLAGDRIAAIGSTSRAAAVRASRCDGPRAGPRVHRHAGPIRVPRSRRRTCGQQDHPGHHDRDHRRRRLHRPHERRADRGRQADLGLLRRHPRLHDPRRLLEGLRARAPCHQPRHLRGRGRGAAPRRGRGRSRRHPRRASRDGRGGPPQRWRRERSASLPRSSTRPTVSLRPRRSSPSPRSPPRTAAPTSPTSATRGTTASTWASTGASTRSSGSRGRPGSRRRSTT